uniref:Uncharacterized protein n=1 Tax=Picea sitchensis TaxID=3332 RepID=A0A6B9XVV7_PICSI|nr:hypothetical protein Q903MT_gene4149 [Picea sitchensis]
MLLPFLQLSNEVVEVSKENMNQVIETVRHGSLECGSSIIESKWHDVIRECPREVVKAILYWSCERIRV